MDNVQICAGETKGPVISTDELPDGSHAQRIIPSIAGLEVARGQFSNLSVIHKFGRNPAVGTTYVPINIGGIYRTPQVAGATALRVKAGNTNDTALGSGAREITLQGIDETGALVTEAIPTAGIAAGADSTATFIRLFRAWVSESGTYATQIAGSHADDVVIENAAGSEDWLTIDATDFPKGQSEIAVYTVPLGKEAYVKSFAIIIGSTKIADVLLFKRGGILDAAAPYEAMREQYFAGGVVGTQAVNPETPLGPYPAGTDVGWMAKVTQATGPIAVDFEILLADV